MVSGRPKDAGARLAGGIAGALRRAGTAGAENKIEIRFGGMQYLSGDVWVERVNEKVRDLVQAGRHLRLEPAGNDTTPAPPGEDCTACRAAVSPAQKSRSS